jgi:hypothetical protein
MKNTLKTLLYWVLLFFILLIGIYILISYQYIVIAKFTGVLIVVFFISALKIWTTNSKKKNLKLKKTQLNLNHRYWLSKNCPFYYSLNSTDKVVFEDRIGLLLSKIGVIDFEKEVSTEMYLSIMAFCTITNWNFPFWDLGTIHYFSNNLDKTILNESRIECSFNSISNSILSSTIKPIDDIQSNPTDEIQAIILEVYKKEFKN